MSARLFPALAGTLLAVGTLWTTGALAGGPAPAASDNQETTVSFAKEVNPLLRQRCAVCHVTGQEPGLLSLIPAKSYDSIVGQDSVQSDLKRVEPGDPEQSYLYHKLVGSHLEAGGEGLQMPFASPPLNETQIDLVKRWIAEGAQNN